MMNNLTRSAMIFLQFLIRDVHCYGKYISRYIINFAIIRPLLFTFSFAYIQANVVFQAASTKFTTIFLIGNAMLIVMILSFAVTVKLLFDCKEERFIDYQLTLLSPRLIILERLVFSTLFSFVFLLPFFPMIKLLLGNSFETSSASWISVFCVLFLGALCCSAYHLLVMCMLKGPKNLFSLWMRLNIPLLWLGGIWAPLYVMRESFPKLSLLAYCNPLIYLTDGLRSAILDSPEFLSVGVCAAALLGFSAVFTLLTFHFFRKKTDHI